MEGIFRITVVIHVPCCKWMELVSKAQFFHLIAFDAVKKVEKVFPRLHVECYLLYLFLIHLFTSFKSYTKIGGLDIFLSETIFFM